MGLEIFRSKEGQRERLSVEEVARLFQGLVIPSVTILNEKLEADIEGQTRLGIETSWMAKALFYGGTSGMGGNPNFKPDLLRTLVEVGVRVRDKVGRGLETDDPLLVICGAYGYTAEQAAVLARAGFEAGANIVVAPPPAFKYNPQRSEIKLPDDLGEMHKYTFRFYRQLADLLGPDVPISAYNIPKPCWREYCMPPELVMEILRIPNVIGIKDSSRNGLLTQEYCDVARLVTEAQGRIKRVLSGFFPTLKGLDKADGGVPIEANLLRLIPLVIWQAAIAKRFEVVEKGQIMAQGFLDEAVGGLEKKGFPYLAEGPLYYLKLGRLGRGFLLPGQSPVNNPELQEQIRKVREKFVEVPGERQLLIAAGVPEEFILQAEQIIAKRKDRAAKVGTLIA